MKTLLTSPRFSIAAVLLFALAVRLVGINHGFPFIFHVDEPAVVRSALGLRFSPNPGHFDWPHLHFYLNYAVYFLFIKFRAFLQILNLRAAVEDIFPLLWRDPLIFYVISRSLSAIMGAFTVIPVYLTGKVLFDKKTALFSAFIFAILPFHVHTSHYALIDVPMVFWLSWALFFAAKVLRSQKVINYLLAGFFIGFAASTKYNGGLFALIVPIAHFMREGKAVFKGVGRLGLSGLLAVFGFFLGTPFAIIDFSKFIGSDSPSGALWQFVNVGKVGLVDQVRQLFSNLLYKLSDDLGYVFLATYLATAGCAFFRRNISLVFLLLPSLFVLFYVSGFEKTRSHYYLGMYPFVALVSGWFVSVLLEKLKAQGYFVKSILCIAFFGLPLFLAFERTYLFTRQDTRSILYDWLAKNVVKEDFLVYDGNDLTPVMEKFNQNRTKKGDLPDVKRVSGTGFFIKSSSDDFDSTLAGMKAVRVIKADMRHGPNIAVYTIGGPQ